MISQPLLFTPIDLRAVRLPNRIVVSPMCQYSAVGGLPTDWHFAHHAKFALGRAGCIFFEASAVTPEGRITHGDLGLWSDEHIEPVRRVVAYVKSMGAAAGMQLAHAGRKGSMQRPWHGNAAMGPSDAARGELPWPIVGPVAVPHNEGWLVPEALTKAGIARIVQGFRAAAARAVAAGLDVLEVHGAPAYLAHSFLSPVSNTRTDEYGGDLAGRMRFGLEVVRAVREAWPAHKPLFYRTSSVDGIDGGLTLDDTVALARELKALGVDVLDCSSGGFPQSRVSVGPNYMVPFAARVRKETGLATQAVGVIRAAAEAEAALAHGAADLVAVAREALLDPHWAGRAAVELEGDAGWAFWPAQYGWWLERRAALLRSLEKTGTR
jgi:2,4-dienoyl-CoA reductase-like NADH-dependent reductase (Old Yellow Enzyme family)